MQPSSSFSFLLAALLFALAQVEAVPVKQPARLVTMPLRRVSQRSDIHPSVRLQQHINRSHRRQARMNGLQGPSDAELAKRLAKRLDQVKYEKRFYRNGVHPISASNDQDANMPASYDPSTVVNLNNQTSTTPDTSSVTDLNNSTTPTGGFPQNSTTSTGGFPQNSTTSSGGFPQNSTTPGGGFPQAGLDALLAGNVTKANKPTTANSLGLDVEGNDVGYLATIQVGTPPRDFSILMDSGSADFWIGGEGCQSLGGGDCGNHVFLGPKSSSSFQDSGMPFNVTYGQGQVAGDIITDNVNIAGLALDKHTFGVALVESVDFSQDAVFDGLMGLAQSPLSNQGVLTPIDSLVKQGLIREAITSYKIPRVSDGLNDGEITFGGLDESKFDPNTLVTVDSISQLGFWEAPLTSSVNGQDLGLNGRTAILDTGTTLLVIPDADAAAIHAMIPGAKSDGQGGFVIPCTTTAVLSFTFGNQTFDINPTDLLFAPLDQNNLQGDCTSSISSGQLGAPTQWLVGDVFLKNVYYSTDATNGKISLAKTV